MLGMNHVLCQLVFRKEFKVANAHFLTQDVISSIQFNLSFDKITAKT